MPERRCVGFRSDKAIDKTIDPVGARAHGLELLADVENPSRAADGIASSPCTGADSDTGQRTESCGADINSRSNRWSLESCPPFIGQSREGLGCATISAKLRSSDRICRRK